MSAKTQQASSPLPRLTAAVFLAILYYLLLLNNYWGAGFTIINFAFAGTLFFLRPEVFRNKVTLFYLASSLALSSFIPFRAFELGRIITFFGVFVLNSLAVSYQAASKKEILSVKNLVLAPLLIAVRSFNELLFWITYFIDAIKSKGKSTSKNGIPKSEIPGLLRGGIVAVPLVVLFTTLLLQADPAFKKFFEDLIPSVKVNWELIRNIVQMLAVFSLASSFLSFQKRSFGEFRLLLASGRLRTEISVAIVAVSAIIGLFLFVQAKTLFAGEEVLKSLGLTHSEYTRQGFGQLVAVSAIGLFLVTFLLHEKTERSILPTKKIGYIFLAEILLLLLSATRRVYLYQNEFGFTQARLLGFLFSLWLFGILAIFFLRLNGRLKANVLHFAVLVNTIAVLILMQGINVDRTVALVRKPNLGHSIDYHYITTLSTDAWPAWEDAIVNFEGKRDCGVEQMTATQGANSLIYYDDLYYLSELGNRNKWQDIGSWVKTDREAKEFLDRNKERLNHIWSSYEKNCVLVMPDRYY